LQTIVSIQQKEGVRDGSAIWVPRSIFNRCTGFIFAQGILPAATRTKLLLASLAANAATASGARNRRSLVSILKVPMEFSVGLCLPPNVIQNRSSSFPYASQEHIGQYEIAE
jgi:hypothetical protein